MSGPNPSISRRMHASTPAPASRNCGPPSRTTTVYATRAERVGAAPDRKGLGPIGGWSADEGDCAAESDGIDDGDWSADVGEWDGEDGDATARDGGDCDAGDCDGGDWDGGE